MEISKVHHNQPPVID